MTPEATAGALANRQKGFLTLPWILALSLLAYSVFEAYFFAPASIHIENHGSTSVTVAARWRSRELLISLAAGGAGTATIDDETAVVFTAKNSAGISLASEAQYVTQGLQLSVSVDDDSIDVTYAIH